LDLGSDTNYFQGFRGAESFLDETMQGESPSHDIPHFCKYNRYVTTSRKWCQLEAEINGQINWELRAFYDYLQLGYYVAHVKCNLPHFSKYFLESAKEKLKRAEDLMQYQITRGAKLDLLSIAAPQKKQFKSSCEAIDHAYYLELKLTKQAERIFRVADQHNDRHLLSHMKTHFITDKYGKMKKLADIQGTLKRIGVCDDSFIKSCDKLAEIQFGKTVMEDLTKS